MTTINETEEGWKEINGRHIPTTKNVIDNKIVTIGWEGSPNFQSWYTIHIVDNDYYEKSGGLVIEGFELIDFDGSYSLPKVVKTALEKNGIRVDDSFIL
jgi:hypothetical protein